MTADVFPVSILLGIIDGLRYLMMPQEEFDRKFNRKYKTRRTTNSSKRQRRQREYYEVKKSTIKSKKPTRRSRVRNNPFKKSGMKKYKDYDIEEAIDDFHKGLKIEPHDIALHFNLACAYSLMEDKEEAFKHLDDAIENGLKDTEKIMSHDDLAFLRIQSEFDDFKANGFQLSRKHLQKDVKKEQEQTSKKPMDDILLAQLNRLMELRKKGVLTEQEFTRERKKILVR